MQDLSAQYRMSLQQHAASPDSPFFKLLLWPEESWGRVYFTFQKVNEMRVVLTETSRDSTKKQR